MQAAKRAFEAYEKATGGTRRWEDLTVREAEAWAEAARAAKQGYWGPG